MMVVADPPAVNSVLFSLFPSTSIHVAKSLPFTCDSEDARLNLDADVREVASVAEGGRWRKDQVLPGGAEYRKVRSEPVRGPYGGADLGIQRLFRFKLRIRLRRHGNRWEQIERTKVRAAEATGDVSSECQRRIHVGARGPLPGRRTIRTCRATVPDRLR